VHQEPWGTQTAPTGNLKQNRPVKFSVDVQPFLLTDILEQKLKKVEEEVSYVEQAESFVNSIKQNLMPVSQKS
jgi:hypothetical protein